MNQFVFAWLVYLLVWFAFTTSLHPQEVLTGAIFSFVIAGFSYKTFSREGLRLLRPHRVLHFSHYIVVFIIELIKSNIDVARRVVDPKLPINPGIVTFRTQLRSDFGKMVLANSITLTPGTLTIDIKNDIFYIHWLNIESSTMEENYQRIAEKFEKILVKVFI